ncbi:hypothetical protein Tco_0289727 [Tanacetum coccineum]
MSPCTKLCDHIDKFNKLIPYLMNIDIEIEDEDHVLMLLTLLPSSYENFMETLLCWRESLTMEDVMATLNSKELKKRTKGTREETDDELYVRRRTMALTEAVKESIWLKGLLIKLGINLRSVVVNCDNQGAIHLLRNAMFYERIKHINLRYHFIREIMESKEIEVAKIGMKDNAADALTRVVQGPKFKYCMKILGVGAN